MSNKTNGTIGVYIHHTKQLVGLVELICETDFVARTIEFRTIADSLAKMLCAMIVDEDITIDMFLQLEALLRPGITVAQYVDTEIAEFKEKITIGRIMRVELGR